jgi:antitoxin component of RelBE/YafQ-DinJ toxin-antitoxin module
MKKVMLSIDAEVLATVRQIANEQGMSLDEYVNTILKKIWVDHVSEKLKQHDR